jgi:hypothetical protein
VAAAVRIFERQARLWGLDAPTQVSLTVEQAEQLVVANGLSADDTTWVLEETRRIQEARKPRAA